MHKSQVFSYLLISFLLGVFIAKYFSDFGISVTVLVLLGTIVTAGSAYEKTFVNTKKAERNRRVGVLIGCCILVMALGVFRYSQADLSNDALAQFAGAEVASKPVPVTLNGFVDAEMTRNGDKGQIIFHVTEVKIPGRVLFVDEKTLAFVAAYPNYNFGDKLSMQGALKLPTNFTPDFDYVEYLKNKDIQTTISYPKISPITSLSISKFQQIRIAIYQKIFAVKKIFQNSVNRSLSPQYAAYINGVLLGTRQDIPQDLTNAFNKTSTTHVLAISGYNITIIAEALLALLVFFMSRRRAFWVSVVVIVLFTVMTGAGASVVRAAVMGLMLLFANGYGRLYDPRNSILFAAAAMVFLDPLSLRFDVGFQLSFLAVMGLMYVGPILQDKFKKIPEWLGLKETVLMSIAAQVAVAPLLAFDFHTFSLVSIPANLLVLPLMPYTMLFGFLTGIAGLVLEPLGRAVGIVAWALSAFQIFVIRWFGGLPFSAVTVVMPVMVLALIYFIIAFGVWSLQKIKSESLENND